jgi:hypothetical protein
MNLNDLSLARDEANNWDGVKCPKCGAFSGDTWSQCEGRCPLDISPCYDPETDREWSKKLGIRERKAGEANTV